MTIEDLPDLLEEYFVLRRDLWGKDDERKDKQLYYKSTNTMNEFLKRRMVEDWMLH